MRSNLASFFSRPLASLVRWPALYLWNEVLLFLDVRLLALKLGMLTGVLLISLDSVPAVVAFEALDAAPLQFPCLTSHSIQKVAVVGHDNVSNRGGAQKAFQPAEPRESPGSSLARPRSGGQVRTAGRSPARLAFAVRRWPRRRALKGRPG